MKNLCKNIFLLAIISGCATTGTQTNIGDRQYTRPPVNSEKQAAIGNALDRWRASQNGVAYVPPPQKIEEPVAESAETASQEIREEVIPPTDEEQGKYVKKLEDLKKKHAPAAPANMRISNKQPKTTASYDSSLTGLADRLAVVEKIITDKVKSAGTVVRFQPGSAKLDPDAQKALDNDVVSDYSAGRIVNITLTGNADHSGGTARNLSFMRQRETAVQQYLAKKGVSAEIISAAAETDQYGVNRNVAIFWDIIK